MKYVGGGGGLRGFSRLLGVREAAWELRGEHEPPGPALLPKAGVQGSGTIRSHTVFLWQWGGQAVGETIGNEMFCQVGDV